MSIHNDRKMGRDPCEEAVAEASDFQKPRDSYLMALKNYKVHQQPKAIKPKPHASPMALQT
jgi:hypothetical protein